MQESNEKGNESYEVSQLRGLLGKEKKVEGESLRGHMVIFDRPNNNSIEVTLNSKDHSVTFRVLEDGNIESHGTSFAKGKPEPFTPDFSLADVLSTFEKEGPKELISEEQKKGRREDLENFYKN